MNTPVEIKRALEALDQTFASPANSKSGKLKFDEWSARRAELVEKLRYAEHVESTSPAPMVAPALSEARLNELFWPPNLPGLPSADAAELAAFNRNFNEAITAGDFQTAQAIAKNPRREALSQSAQLAHVASAMRDSYAKNGVRMFATLVVGAISAAMHELNESRLAARAHRTAPRMDAVHERLATVETRTGALSMLFGKGTGANADAIRAFETMEARIAALETSIPKYVGVHRSGATYTLNSICTHKGSMWIATHDTATSPPGADWQQCVRGIRS